MNKVGAIRETSFGKRKYGTWNMPQFEEIHSCHAMCWKTGVVHYAYPVRLSRLIIRELAYFPWCGVHIRYNLRLKVPEEHFPVTCKRCLKKGPPPSHDNR